MVASVIIDNTEKRQIEGTTLLNLQSSFPNCWLTRCEDNVEIRVPAYVLENRKKYILNKAAQSGTTCISFYYEFIRFIAVSGAWGNIYNIYNIYPHVPAPSWKLLKSMSGDTLHICIYFAFDEFI